MRSLYREMLKEINSQFVSQIKYEAFYIKSIPKLKEDNLIFQAPSSSYDRWTEAYNTVYEKYDFGYDLKVSTVDVLDIIKKEELPVNMSKSTTIKPALEDVVIDYYTEDTRKVYSSLDNTRSVNKEYSYKVYSIHKDTDIDKTIVPSEYCIVKSSDKLDGIKLGKLAAKTLKKSRKLVDNNRRVFIYEIIQSGGV